MRAHSAGESERSEKVKERQWSGMFNGAVPVTNSTARSAGALFLPEQLWGGAIRFAPAEPADVVGDCIVRCEHDAVESLPRLKECIERSLLLCGQRCNLPVAL